MLGTALGIVAVIAFVSTLCVAVGYVLLLRTGLLRNNSFLTFGGAFFVGTAGLITLIGIFEQVFTSARLGVIVSLMMLLFVSGTFIRWDVVRVRLNLHLSLFFILLATMWFGVNMIHALQPMPSSVLEPATAHPSLGFLAAEHSFRIGNVIDVIVETDRFPYINQNYAQALLAYVPSEFGFDAPQFSILVWHTVVLFFAGIFVYGCARFFLSASLALWPTIFVLLGNAAFSYRYISVTDSGHALLLARNFEVVISLCLFVVALIFIRHTLLTKTTPTLSSLVLFLIACAWSVAGGHYYLIFLATIAVMVVYFKNMADWQVLTKGILLSTLGFISGTLMFGGLFAIFAPPSTIPGVKSLQSDEAAPLIELRPFRTVEAEYHVQLKLAYLLDKSFSASPVNVEAPDDVPESTSLVQASDPSPQSTSFTTYTERLQAIIASLKTNPTIWNLIRFVRSLQLVALALVGLGIAYWIFFYKKIIDNQSIRDMYVVLLPLFFGGWLISSLILIYGQYGEVSRFFAPGVGGSLFLSGLTVAVLLSQPSVMRRILGYTIACVTILPVVATYFIIDVFGNFVLPPTQALLFEYREQGVAVGIDDALTMSERVELLFSPSTTRSGTD